MNLVPLTPIYPTFYGIVGHKVEKLQQAGWMTKFGPEVARRVDTAILVDGTSVYADWMNNDNLRNQLATDLYTEGYPPDTACVYVTEKVDMSFA